MHLSKFVHTKTGKTFLSIILGLGLATLFRRLCKDGDSSCVVYKSAPLKEIEENPQHFDNKCYSFKSQPVGCKKNENNDKKIVQLSLPLS